MIGARNSADFTQAWRVHMYGLTISALYRKSSCIAVQYALLIEYDWNYLT